jgi:hypothetical protein
MTTINKSIIVNADRDAYHCAYYAKKEQPWKKVTNYKKIKHAQVEPRPPSVEGSRADQHYRTEPGLYSASLKKKINRSVPSPIGQGLSTLTNKKKKKSPTSSKTKKKQTKTSKKKSNKNIKDANIRDGNMPPYLVREMDTLDTTEFKVALGFWMTHFNFTGLTTMPAAYDESRYPDPEVNQYVRRNKQYEATEKIRGARKQMLDLCKNASN